MSCPVQLNGSLSVGSQSCGGYSTGSTQPSSKTMALSFGCSGQQYEVVISTDCAVTLNSPSAFVDIPGSASVSNFKLISIKSSQPIDVQIDGGDSFKVHGQFLVQFGSTYPTSVQVQGSSQIEVLVAGDA